MESLGKRKYQEQEHNDESDSDQNGQIQQSEEEGSEDSQPRKRARHDSQDSGQDEIDQEDQEFENLKEDEEQQEMNEEQRLWMEAQSELLKEDEMFKNMTKDEIQRILNESNGDTKLDKINIKKQVTNLRQTLNENLELRMKYRDEPEQFLDSEAELHSAIKEIQVISALPQFISDFVSAEGVQTLIEILDHPNPDITNESIILLVELTDEEMLSNPGFQKVAEILISNDIWNFIIRVLQKLDDNVEDERPQIFRCMTLLENLLDFDQDQVSNKLMHVDTLIDWFLIYLTDGDVKSENYLQIAELLFTIIQNANEEYKAKFTNTMQGMERLLSVINLYRKQRHLQLEEELEAIANIFDTISALLLIQENLDHFRKLEGFELLMNICKKEKLFRRHVIKVFDYALGVSGTVDTSKSCRHFIDKGGLSIIFAFFMMNQEVKNKQKKKKIENEIYVKLTADEIQLDESRILNILISLLLITAPDSVDQSQVIHERVLFKFIENDFEKLQRLFELHLKYYQKLSDFDLGLFKDAEEIDYLVQDYGFNLLEQVDFLIAYLKNSEIAIKLSQGDLINLKIKEFMKLNGIKEQTIKEVLDISTVKNKELGPNNLYNAQLTFLINQL